MIGARREPPWPPERYPSPEELADWIRSLPREEAVEVCAKLIDSWEAAARCAQSHGGFPTTDLTRVTVA